MLGKKAKHSVEFEPEIFFSSLSIAEFKIKAMLGKSNFPNAIYEAIIESELIELPFSAGHALELGRFGSLTKHEPFDRMILSQASHERFKLLTADQRLLNLGLDFIRDATI
jgi:PIN domain nuclease of toxin-antitoxin system